MEQTETCCFTGHRPDKLPWGIRENDPRCADLKARLAVTLEAARPCESQASRWPQEEQRRYQRILERCDYETLVQHQYDRWCMMRRNRYMVDRSARLLAVYDGVPKGGTAQTLAYALRKGLAVTILPPV